MARHTCDTCGMHIRRAGSLSEPYVAQTAYIGRTSPHIPCQERGRFPHVTETLDHPSSCSRTQYARRDSSRGVYGLPPSPDAALYSPPMTAPEDSRQTYDSYDTRNVPSQIQRPTPSPPMFAKPRSPPLDSEWGSSTKGSIDSNSPQPESGIAAFPGTMASKNQPPRTSNKTRSSTRKGERKLTLAGRCKAMMKDIFTHHAVDESQLERIESMHWADGS